MRFLRALGLALVALVLMSAMVWLGLWQFHVYDDHQRADALAALHRPPVPLDSVLGRDAAFPADGTGQPITVSGTFLPAEQVYVRGMPGATNRYAVVTPLLTANGSAVLVVRGAQEHLGSPAADGQVTVGGILEPSQSNGAPIDSRRVTNALTVSSLVNAVGPDLYSGYVLQVSSSPAPTPALTPVAPTLPTASRWSGIKNLLYACQWWVFAGFVAFMWWRITYDRSDREAAVAEPAEADTGSLTPLR